MSPVSRAEVGQALYNNDIVVEMLIYIQITELDLDSSPRSLPTRIISKFLKRESEGD